MSISYHHHHHHQLVYWRGSHLENPIWPPENVIENIFWTRVNNLVKFRLISPVVFVHISFILVILKLSNGFKYFSYNVRNVLNVHMN